MTSEPSPNPPHAAHDIGKGEFEIYYHGTTADNAAHFEVDLNRNLYTAVDPAVAHIFAQRTAARVGGQPGMVMIAIPRPTAIRLQQQGLLRVKGIDDMPGKLEFIFKPNVLNDNVYYDIRPVTFGGTP